MTNYYGLVVRATPNQLLDGEQFICVADRADGTCWLIPVDGRSSSSTTKYVPKNLWNITVDDDAGLEYTFRKVIDKLTEFVAIRAGDGDFDSKNVRSAKDNLGAAQACYDELYQAIASPAYPAEEVDGTPDLVASLGGIPFQIVDFKILPAIEESKVGKIIVVEFDDGDAGEYMVVFESDNSYYMVPTLNVIEGIQIMRVLKSNLTIIDEFRDDAFITEFVERLTEFGERDDLDPEEAYAFVTIDTACTTARQLARCLERNGGGAIGAFQRFADALCGGR